MVLHLIKSLALSLFRAEREVQMTQKNRQELANTRFKDSSGKLIFKDPILCAQFLRDYLDIPLLKDVQPEDIEDETERFVHLFTEERNSDVVKRVRIKEGKTSFYLISLIEHKSEVDYNVVMQIFRYMAFIWEDYEKEQNRKHKGMSKTKGFKYPPILPIIYYEGSGSWTAATRLHDRVYLSDVLGEYVPDYRCIMIQLNEYTNLKLMEKEDELSVIMMLNKLQERADFASLKKEVPIGYFKKVTEGTPEYLLGIIEQVIEILLSKLNVPQEEAEEFAGQVKERKMGELFAVLEKNLQRDRQKWKEEGIEQGIEQGIEEGIKAFVLDYMEEGIPRERLLEKLQKRFKLSEERSRYFYDKFSVKS